MATEVRHIPFFPLNIFLLPGEQMPLHIFEPRYRQLFAEAEQGKLLFGLPFEDKKLGFKVVSVCRLLKVMKRHQGGELDVIIEANEVAMLNGYEPRFPGKMYPGGSISFWSNQSMNEAPIHELVQEFRTYISLRYGTKPTLESIASYRIIDLAASIGLSTEDKVKFIRLSSSKEQCAFLLKSVHYLNLLLVQEGKTERGILLN
jgi:hypothetical protein